MTDAEMRTALVLVDGEHYPPVLRDALARLAGSGVRPVAALFLGGTEKVASYGAEVNLGVPVRWAPRGEGIAGAGSAIATAAGESGADIVYDLSDEPVLDARTRLHLASRVLRLGLPYVGADFELRPPPRPRTVTRPSIAVIGTGKRTGKTAVAGELARTLIRHGHTPVVVAMGRGGPPDPVVVPAGTPLEPADLLRVADLGGHAASDFYEDAITTGASTVGARRCGGGLAGAVADTNFDLAVRAADELPGDLTILEGSGASIPPAHADATVLVTPGDCDPEFLQGYLGPYRVLLADLVVVTMCESPRASPRQVESVVEAIGNISRTTPILRTVFRPVPLGPVAGSTVFFATTAPAAVCTALSASLEERYGCEVVATSSNLADRPQLQAELEAAPAFEILLVECKAAAVDVAVRTADRVGARVVFCDNRPLLAPSDDEPAADSDSAVPRAMVQVADLAVRRFHGG